jgi:hypothetical protein
VGDKNEILLNLLFAFQNLANKVSVVAVAAAAAWLVMCC